jgi:N-ethylmaleimide reductase
MNERRNDLGALHRPLTLGALQLPNRIIMSPMTRVRSAPDGSPTELMAEYYGQRASAGLVVTESIAVRPYGEGYPVLPGIFSAEQRAGWRRVVERVHREGGRIAAQLWDVGLPRKVEPGSPPGWAIYHPLTPAQLSADDIAAMLAGYAAAAHAAGDAGFDAVEIHGGSGNLLDRFLRRSSNARSDAYGGSPSRRLRLLHDILDRVTGAIGVDRVGLKLSPSATVAGAPDPHAEADFAAILAALGDRQLAYLHLTRATADDRAHGSGPGIALTTLRHHYRGALLGAGDFTQAEGEQAIAEGWLDGVIFGRLFLANPDLPARFAAGAALNVPDVATFYTPGAAGYTDYPTMATASADRPSRRSML